MDAAERPAGIPATLIHGRHEVSGPVLAAWQLHRCWPGSELVIEDGEGHGRPAMVARWREANSRMADLIPSGRPARPADVEQ